MCRAKFIANIQKNASFPIRFSLCIDVLCKAKSCFYYNVIFALQMLILKRFGLLSYGQRAKGCCPRDNELKVANPKRQGMFVIIALPDG